MQQSTPRPEYPRPQFSRPAWMNLNGVWQFEMDFGASGRERGLVQKERLDSEILVPFCMESTLSGIGYTDFVDAVWYRRTFTLPPEAIGKRVLLHFGAVDYQCQAWVNGQSVGVHQGGYASFTFEITAALQAGENTLVVCADDQPRGGRQPSGKQSHRYHSFGCSYTRTTGIWQTVWLEWVSDSYLDSVKIIPDAANGTVYLDVLTNGAKAGMEVSAQALYQGAEQASRRVKLDGAHARITLTLPERHLWEPGTPCLYDLKLTLWQDQTALDAVDSYFALRTVSFDGKRCLINGKPVFQRLVLDQGFYPDGIYTAPTDDALKNDILLSMQMGFNGARLHQKVFEQRFLYWADQLGYLCWGEMPSWGIDPARPHTMSVFLQEWLQVIDRDFNAPCIIGWCPYNETWGEEGDGLRPLTLQATYRATKAVDPTRPCIDTSGGIHVETDIYDTHDYEQDPEVFRQRYQPGAPLYDRLEKQQHYDGRLPMFVSEYGGIRWTDDAAGWGYGVGPKTRQEFLDRYAGLTTALLRNPEHMGFCYTQLTDVEQEQNGLYTYHRHAKFDPALIAAVNQQKAAMEEE
ncbi:MAG: beta galactosidase jelly roll domain-containing protein [Clostridiales bacterium]|nr:beta galactosidase jelly roll domain-containing protein [Clostridiales bacterium]